MKNSGENKASKHYRKQLKKKKKKVIKQLKASAVT